MGYVGARGVSKFILAHCNRNFFRENGIVVGNVGVVAQQQLKRVFSGGERERCFCLAAAKVPDLGCGW